MTLAPRDAIAVLSAVGRHDGMWEVSWATPRGKVTTLEYYPNDRRLDMGAGPTLLQQVWDMLDKKTDIILGQLSGDDDDIRQRKQQARYEARGIAEVLATFMVPHFSSADEIVREAVKRRKAREAGDTEYETVGLGSRRYEPPPGTPVRSLDEKPKPPTKGATTVKTNKTIPDSAVESAKTGIESGMFSVDMVAKMYSMTASEVKTQLGLP